MYSDTAPANTALFNRKVCAVVRQPKAFYPQRLEAIKSRKDRARWPTKERQDISPGAPLEWVRKLKPVLLQRCWFDEGQQKDLAMHQ